eukprot:1451782-Ditylum_brightwellii.AAC.1
MHDSAGRDPLGSHVGLSCSIPMGNAMEVVPAGHSDGLPFGMIVGVLSEVNQVEDCCVYLPHNGSNH